MKTHDDSNFVLKMFIINNNTLRIRLLTEVITVVFFVIVLLMKRMKKP